ncbi:MAG: hypothetical protein II931_06140 [Clostridia bacterium]|nr:hypothetical protein [Clostridia bacterium]
MNDNKKIKSPEERRRTVKYGCDYVPDNVLRCGVVGEREHSKKTENRNVLNGFIVDEIKNCHIFQWCEGN